MPPRKFDNPTAGYVFRDYQRWARIRGHVFEIDYNRFVELTSQNCVYCHAPPRKTVHTRGHEFNYNGIDRMDNDEGYTEENIVPCCFICNKAKNNMTHQEFIDYLYDVWRAVNIEEAI